MKWKSTSSNNQYVEIQLSPSVYVFLNVDIYGDGKWYVNLSIQNKHDSFYVEPELNGFHDAVEARQVAKNWLKGYLETILKELEDSQ